MAGEEPGLGRLPLPPKLSPRGTGRRNRHEKSRGPRRYRWLTTVAGTLSFLVLATSAFAYGYYQKLDGNIRRVKVFTYAQAVDRPQKTQDGAMNILLVGSDSRDGATKEQLADALTTADGGGLNTDTIILMHISPDNVVTLVSFPRDSWVKIPGHSDFKINAAFADGESDSKGGGPALLTQTVENLTGVHIDHFIEVGFFQFINISNAIGGVEVCIQTPNGKGAHEANSGIDLPEGRSVISGSQALAFVRQRYDLPHDDYDRIDRQRRFISAVVKKIRTIRNPATFNALLDKVTSSITVDESLSGQGLIKLVDRLKDIDLSSIQFQTPPVIDPHPPKYLSNGQLVSYVQLDMDKLPAFFANVVNDSLPPTTPGTTPTVTPSPVAPSAVDVTILNGRGTANDAGNARTTLRGYGFGVASIGDTTRTSTTTIRYGASQVAAAAVLAKAVPGAKLVQDNGLGSIITLTLGTDYLSLVNPATSSTKPAVPVPTPSSTAPPITAANLDCGP